ncbi:bifunctional lysylphosphatidylglycerol flippase/synthetase MprF [Kineosporia succinea]
MAVLGAAVAAVVVLQQRLSGYPWHSLNDDLAAIGAGPVLLAVLATAASYSIMVVYDAMALSYVEHAMPPRRYAAASFVATAFGNTLGASAIVGAALRARLYSAWGLPAFAITRVAAFNLITLSLGSSVLMAVGLGWAPPLVLDWLPFGRPVAQLLAGVLAVGVLAYLAWCGRGKEPVTVRSWRVDRPTRTMALTQLVVSVVEWLTMAAVLYVLLPDGHGLGFVPFAVLFVLATTLGLLSNVPGGLGVVEAVLVLALADSTPSTGLVTALVAYRLIYYLLPLGLAAVVLAVLEARRDPDRTNTLVRVADILTPSVMALLLVVLGALMIITGQVPGASSSPLSAFVTSLGGVGVLVLARGLHRRLQGAWGLTIIALLVFAATHRTLLAVAAVVLTVLLVLARRVFRRTTSLLTDPRGWAWPLAVTGIATALVWWHNASLADRLGDRTVPATVTGEGSSFTRLVLAGAVIALIVVGIRLQRPSAGPLTASEEDLIRAVPVMAHSSHGNACLIWTGDKRILFSEKGNALLMFRVEGRSWVVMGDPVGEESEFDDLIWRFLDLVNSRAGRPVFYCVRDDLADLYRSHGLLLNKLGEEAMIPLADFTMTGSKRSKLRSECRASTKAGVSIEILEGEALRAVLPQLREVSDQWLAKHNTREKSFSLGAFDEEYVSRFPVAVARIEDDVVAFASLWASGARHEVKVDLMRRRLEAPRTVMTHLFVESMLWAQAEGYDTFNIGMAPLSGMRTDGTFWERAGHLLWTHGEHFYNFQGLRQFKERFGPEWETRYVASFGGPALPVVMLDVAVLVSGGFRGMVPHLHKIPSGIPKPSSKVLVGAAKADAEPPA